MAISVANVRRKFVYDVQEEIKPQEESPGVIPPTASRGLRAGNPSIDAMAALGVRNVLNAERQLQTCSCDTSPEVRHSIRHPTIYPIV